MKKIKYILNVVGAVLALSAIGFFIGIPIAVVLLLLRFLGLY